jgi:hypothetical protein
LNLCHHELCPHIYSEHPSWNFSCENCFVDAEYSSYCSLMTHSISFFYNFLHNLVQILVYVAKSYFHLLFVLLLSGESWVLFCLDLRFEPVAFHLISFSRLKFCHLKHQQLKLQLAKECQFLQDHHNQFYLNHVLQKNKVKINWKSVELS